jgi:hypothetical protein
MTEESESNPKPPLGADGFAALQEENAALRIRLAELEARLNREVPYFREEIKNEHDLLERAMIVTTGDSLRVDARQHYGERRTEARSGLQREIRESGNRRKDTSNIKT